MPSWLYDPDASSARCLTARHRRTALNPPPWQQLDGDLLRVGAAAGRDFWRETAYGFTHDNGHAMLSPFPDDSAVEVSFLLDFTQQFDQAGVLVRAGERDWVKAGVEVSDGLPQVGPWSLGVSRIGRWHLCRRGEASR